MTKEQRMDEINNLCLFLMEVNSKLNGIEDKANELGYIEVASKVRKDIPVYKAFEKETMDDFIRLEEEFEQEDMEEYERSLESIPE